MSLLHYSKTTLMAILLLILGYSHKTLIAQEGRVRYAQTPQIDSAYAKGVSGHMAVLSQGYLLMAGGCNFPDKSALEGGKKRFYSDIYIADLYKAGRTQNSDTIKLSWTKLSHRHLPKPTAYAGSIPYQTPNGKTLLLVAGGKSDEGDLKKVYYIEVYSDSHCSVGTLPDLPEPRSGMATVIKNDRFYLIGGSVSGRLSNSVISLDLLNLKAGWRNEEPYPHSPFLKLVGCKEYDKIGFVGSFTGVEDPNKAVEADVTVMTYEPEARKWETFPVAEKSLLKDLSFGGGCSVGWSPSFFGGVRSSIFVKALEREKQLKQAREAGDKKLILELEGDGRAYLDQDPTWYGFTPNWYDFDFKKRDWVQPHGKSMPARADAVYLSRPDGNFNGILIGGEIKPGVRSSDIFIFEEPKINISIISL